MPEYNGCELKWKTEPSNVIKVPSNLSKAMKEWCKDTMRTQPSDLLRWSAVYFRMKANGEHPPVCLSMRSSDLELGPGGLNLSTLKALVKSLSNEFETSEKIKNTWSFLSLGMNIYLEIIDIGKFKTNIKSIEFIAIAAAYLSNRLRDTMVILCDTLSDEYPKGIPLDTFVTIYTYLARLDGRYFVTAERVASEEVEKTAVHYDSQSFVSADSQTDSDVDDNLGSDCAVAESATNSYTIQKSEEGIGKYQSNSFPVQVSSFAEALNETAAAEVPMIACNDPDQLLAFREMKPNTYDDELLSLLSGSSTISDHDLSVMTFGSSDVDDVADGREHSAEELGGEETMNGSLFTLQHVTAPEHLSGDEDVLDEHGFADGTDADECQETDAVDYNVDAESYENDRDYVRVNTDFIVMFVLVDSPPVPLPVPVPEVAEDDDPPSEAEHESLLSDHESAETVFSLLEHSGLAGTTAAAADEQTDQARVRTFDEKDHYTVADKESTGSEPGSDVSHEFQYSEIDQLSAESAPPPDVRSLDVTAAEANGSRASQGDAHSLDNDYEQFEVDEHDENEQIVEWTYDEGETHSYSHNTSAVPVCEDVEADETVESENVRAVQILSGIGPPLPEQQIQQVIDYLTECAQSQNNHVHGHNLIHFMCPPLDHHHHD